LLGAAYLSRIHTIVSLPVFLYLLYNNKKAWLKNFFYLGLGLLPFVFFNFFYNFVRFGTIFDKAYFILPEILNETNQPWFIHGVASVLYIPRGLAAAFWSFPKIINQPPFIEPSWYSLAIWITTPAFVFAFLAPLKEKVTQLLWLTVVLIFAIVLTHGGVGWAQFGYRFAVDFYPFLILLTIKGVARNGVKPIHWFFLIISVLVNLWGVLWINKFGWVSF
jgi:hypothetical protein